VPVPIKDVLPLFSRFTRAELVRYNKFVPFSVDSVNLFFPVFPNFILARIVNNRSTEVRRILTWSPPTFPSFNAPYNPCPLLPPPPEFHVFFLYFFVSIPITASSSTSGTAHRDRFPDYIPSPKYLSSFQDGDNFVFSVAPSITLPTGSPYPCLTTPSSEVSFHGSGATPCKVAPITQTVSLSCVYNLYVPDSQLFVVNSFPSAHTQ